MIRFVATTIALAGAIAACSCFFSESEEAKTPGEPAVRRELPDVQGMNVSAVYLENCAKCHGERGEGGGGGTKSLLTEEKFDQKHDKPYFDAIKKGVPDMGMEAYGETMRDELIWGLVVHIREMQARALRERTVARRQLNRPYDSKYHRYRIEDFAVEQSGLETPWGIDWLPDGRMLVTNRPGSVVVVQNGRVAATIQGIPASREIGQGGMMEVAVHPDYAKNGWVYLSFTDPAAGGGRGGMTKVVRGKIQFSGSTARWTDQQTIFEADASTYNSSGVHFGSRIAFDGKGKIFFSIGERGNGTLAQDLTKPNGKIYRVNEDGSIPSDNPFASGANKLKGVLGAIWSYGHRNPQGLVFGLDGHLWDTEHGPRGGDEVNLIQKGANYGWPLVAFSINYNDSPYRTPWPQPSQNITLPIFRWLPSIGACGLDVVKGSAFPKWKGDLMAGGLSGANVDRIRTLNGKFVEREEILFGMGRVREVATGPDGFIYVALNQPDKIVRIVPEK